MVRIKRVYDPPSPDDGERILVDRLWPRGLTRALAKIDAWPRDIAPSDRLRRWFHADESRWEAFRRRYRRELAGRRELMAEPKDKTAKGTVTLLYAARDSERNNAVVLKQILAGRRRGGAETRPERPATARRRARGDRR
jgi:uncharacterized protein YeaO (DUF488 family)